MDFRESGRCLLIFTGKFSFLLFQIFDGEENLFVSLDDVKNLLGWNFYTEMQINITGSVSEELTGITLNETVAVQTKETKIKVDALYKPNTIKPGLSYTAYVSDAGRQRCFSRKILPNFGLISHFLSYFCAKWCSSRIPLPVV